jgi:hypothetical protein
MKINEEYTYMLGIIAQMEKSEQDAVNSAINDIEHIVVDTKDAGIIALMTLALKYKDKVI